MLWLGKHGLFSSPGWVWLDATKLELKCQISLAYTVWPILYMLSKTALSPASTLLFVPLSFIPIWYLPICGETGDKTNLWAGIHSLSTIGVLGWKILCGEELGCTHEISIISNTPSFKLWQGKISSDIGGINYPGLRAPTLEVCCVEQNDVLHLKAPKRVIKM